MGSPITLFQCVLEALLEWESNYMYCGLIMLVHLLLDTFTKINHTLSIHRLLRALSYYFVCLCVCLLLFFWLFILLVGWLGVGLNGGLFFVFICVFVCCFFVVFVCLFVCLLIF